MAKAKRHVHKYKRTDLGYAEVMSCALPDCPHYMPKHMEKTLEGKYSYCWNCEEKFLLDSNALKMEFPKCVPCRTGVRKEATEENIPVSDALREYLEKLH